MDLCEVSGCYTGPGEQTVPASRRSLRIHRAVLNGAEFPANPERRISIRSLFVYDVSLPPPETAMKLFSV